MLVDSGEYNGKAGGDVGCFLSVYAQCAAFFFDLISTLMALPLSSITQTHP